MVRTFGLAVLFAWGFAGTAAAQNNFDATGQLYLGFKLGPTDQEDAKPQFGFRFGSSTMTRTKRDQFDPVRSNLNTRFDRNNSVVGNFSGLKLGFDEDGRTHGFLGDAFKGGEAGRRGNNAYNMLDSGSAYGLDQEAEAYDFASQLSSPYAWMPSPLIDRAETPQIGQQPAPAPSDGDLIFKQPE